MAPSDKPLVWLHGEVKTSPFSSPAWIECGYLLRRLQQGEAPGLPWSRPIPSIAAHCHELRITDQRGPWRIVYRIDEDAIVFIEIFAEKTQQTPKNIIASSRKRIRQYNER